MQGLTAAVLRIIDPQATQLHMLHNHFICTN